MKINKELLKSITVLYVEDEDFIKEEVLFFCKRFIPNFFTAKNGVEGIKLFNEIEADVIITDIQMPEMNGIEMIKNINGDVPIIITTAYSDIEFFLQAIELNVNKFIIKPIDLRELLFEIQECVSNYRLKDRLYEKENLLKIIDENVLLSITNKEGVIIEVSHSFCDFVGYTREELVGSTHRILRHEDTPESFYENLWNEIKKGKVFKTEIRNRKKSGEVYWANLTITPVFNEDGEIDNYTAIRQDITNKKNLEKLAIKDELTNLYNRRYFNTTIEKQLRRAKREETYLSLAIIDIDFFKNYNDTYGHPNGDKALLKVATVLKNRASRASDYAFRMGGEEFCLLFTGSNQKESLEYINSVVKDIESLEIEHKSSDCSDYLTISAGLVVLSYDNLIDAKDFYKYADDALYESKKMGKNQTILSQKSKN